MTNTPSAMTIDGEMSTAVVYEAVGPYHDATVQAVATPDGWNSTVLEVVRSNNAEVWELLETTPSVELSADGMTVKLDCSGFLYLGVRVKTAAGSQSRIKITICAQTGAGVSNG